MQKDELLHLHLLMFHIRKYYQDIAHDEIPTGRYDSLEISPIHIHKDKKSHSDAVLTLGDEIVSHLHARKLPAVACPDVTAPSRVAVGP
jgi:hypothetical protein